MEYDVLSKKKKKLGVSNISSNFKKKCKALKD